MKPSEIIQDAIDSGMYKGYGHDAGDFMCIAIKYNYPTYESVTSLIDEKIEKNITLHTYLVDKGTVSDDAYPSEINAAQFKFWADFINELKEKGM